jgi:hypothetical protein
MRAYLTAQGIVSAVQCLLIWLVVVVSDRKLAREWEQAFERWTTDHNEAGPVEGVMEAGLERRAGSAGPTMPPITRPDIALCRFRAPRPRGRRSQTGC